MNIIRKSSYAVFPLLLIGLVYYFIIQGSPLLDKLNNHQYYLWPPVILLALNIFLGLYFNINKFVFISIFLGLTYFYTSGLVINNWSGYQRFVSLESKNLFLYLIPINFMVFSLTPERGFFTQKGLIKLSAIILQFLLVPLIYYNFGDSLRTLFDSHFFHRTLPFSNINYAASVLILIFILSNLALDSTTDKKRYLLLMALISSSLPLMPDLEGIYFENSPVNLLLFFSLSALFIFLGIFIINWIKVYKDELTDVLNRRALNEEMKKLHHNYSIAMVDIDHFKKINDKYGHELGDKALKKIAGILKRVSTGKVFRFGGEEFTIIYNHNNLKQIKEDSENLRAAIEATKIKITTLKNRGFKVTISIGISFHDLENNKPDLVLKTADKYLYKAKKSGRNRVHIARIKVVPKKKKD